MKRLYTLLTVVIALFWVGSLSGQTGKLTVADLTGRWKFTGTAVAMGNTVQKTDFEYIFNPNSTITYKWGEVRPYTIKGKDIVITDRNGMVSVVHVEKIGNGEMTVITDYKTPKASAPIVFKKVK